MSLFGKRKGSEVSLPSAPSGIGLGVSGLSHMQQIYMQRMVQSSGFMGSIGAGPASPERPNTVDIAKVEALKKAEPRKVLCRVPDRMEVITAWRAWYPVSIDGAWRLRAMGRSTIWEPKKMLAACCITMDGTNGQHVSPFANCHCGIWAFSTVDVLVEALQGQYPASVIGQVSLWGKIIECENGFRAQYAYPSELWLFDNSLEELGYIYGVPVRTV